MDQNVWWAARVERALWEEAMSAQRRAFLPDVQELIDDLVPICHRVAEGRGRYAISIGGSQGKGTWDRRSDVDFRLFIDGEVPGGGRDEEPWKHYFAAYERWAERGILIDGIWTRRIGEIDEAIDRWLTCDIRPQEMVWTIWGYHVLPDIYHQFVIEDPYNVIGAWKQRLSVYPPALKRAILDKYLASIGYWREDYHYRSKVRRGDVVFLAGLTARLVHDLIQILFALNETYYVGDGQNLDFVAKFPVVPPGFIDNVKAILYPAPGEDVLQRQYDMLAGLIDEVRALAGERMATPS
jgi:hypothetical protein